MAKRRIVLKLHQEVHDDDTHLACAAPAQPELHGARGRVGGGAGGADEPGDGALTALHGWGGVGKTQTALEYCYRHRADLADLATPLGLPEAGERDITLVAAAVRGWLETHPGWLPVLDNATEPYNLTDHLPQNGPGHVLVTSRTTAWRNMGQPISVSPLPRERAIDFLLKRTGQDDRAAAGRLAEALGDLPLALEQAGAFIETTGMSCDTYLALFQQHSTALFKKEGRIPIAQYPDSVATTWTLSFDRLAQETRTATALLRLCAFLAPDNIPLDMVQAGDSLSVPRLVQAVTRDGLSDDDCGAWAGAAVNLVNDAFPGDISTNPRSWPVCARLLPHAQAAAGHAEALGVAAEATGRLLNQVAIYLWGRAELKETRAHFERALRIDEAHYGPGHPTVARDVNNLGSVLRVQGDLAGARAHFKRALRIWQAFLGDGHPNTAIARRWLAIVEAEIAEPGGGAGER